jgi:hypothetical protein
VESGAQRDGDGKSESEDCNGRADQQLPHQDQDPPKQERDRSASASAEGNPGLQPPTLSAIDRYALWTMWFTGVLAVATVVLAAFTIWLAWSTKDIRDFAERQASDMKEAVSASNRQAAASEDANRLAKDSLTYLQRPWLDIAIGNHPFPQGRVDSITLHVKNVGNSTAINVTSECEASLILKEGSDIPDKNYIEKRTAVARFLLMNNIVFSNETKDMDTYIKYLKENVQLNQLFLLCTVYYKDMQNSWHLTRVCHGPSVLSALSGANGCSFDFAN